MKHMFRWPFIMTLWRLTHITRNMNELRSVIWLAQWMQINKHMSVNQYVVTLDMPSFYRASAYLSTVNVHGIGIVPHRSYITRLKCCWHQTVLSVWYKRIIAIGKFQCVYILVEKGERLYVVQIALLMSEEFVPCTAWHKAIRLSRSISTARLSLHIGRVTE